MKIKNYILISIPVIIVIIAVIVLIKKLSTDEPTVITGFVETKVVSVASEIPGRIDSIFVEEGDFVKKGQIIAKLSTSVMEAKIAQAKAVVQQGEWLYNKALTGAREGEKKAYENQYKMAKSQFEFAEKSYERLKVLYQDSIISKQEMDEMQFKYDAAKEQMKAAKEIYKMAVEGARREDIKMAQGKYLQAQGVFMEAEHFYEQTVIRAPITGEINAKLSEEGEVMAAGFPIMSIQDLSKIHAVINVREDLLPNFKKGMKVKAKIAALGNNEYEFKVVYLAPLADFANWLPTKDKGEFDLKTFEVKLYPVQNIPDLKPGMTIQIYLDLP